MSFCERIASGELPTTLKVTPGAMLTSSNVKTTMFGPDICGCETPIALKPLAPVTVIVFVLNVSRPVVSFNDPSEVYEFGSSAAFKDDASAKVARVEATKIGRRFFDERMWNLKVDSKFKTGTSRETGMKSDRDMALKAATDRIRLANHGGWDGSRIRMKSNRCELEREALRS